MQILDNLIIILLHIACFVAGLKLANYYNRQTKTEVNEALQKQYMRLRTGMDADDPCKPYVKSSGSELMPEDLVPTEYDEDMIPNEFMDRLHENGSASMKISKIPS